MIDCRDTTRLTVAAQTRALSLGERFEIALHRLFCPPCRFYRRQLDSMRKVATCLRDSVPAGEAALDESARERIRARLRSAERESQSNREI